MVVLSSLGTAVVTAISIALIVSMRCLCSAVPTCMQTANILVLSISLFDTG